MNVSDLTAKRIATFNAQIDAIRVDMQRDAATLALELNSGPVNSSRLLEAARRMAGHEAKITACEDVIRELSILAIVLDGDKESDR